MADCLKEDLISCSPWLNHTKKRLHRRFKKKSKKTGSYTNNNLVFTMRLLVYQIPPEMKGLLHMQR